LASALVIGWAAWFGVAVLDHGAEWALRHLRNVLPVLAVMFGASVVALLFVKPLWVPLGVGYPAVIGLVLGVARSRQMIRVKQQGGFGEIDASVRSRLLRRYGQGLILSAVVSGLAGAVVVGAGYWQGGILIALGLMLLVVRMRARSGESV
jgi:hypothetical protein